MPDQIVLNQEELTQPASKPMHVHFARYISVIFSPAVVSVPFVVLVALYRASNTLLALGYAFTTLLFLSAGPLVYILIGVRTGKFTDADVSVRSQRAGPFLFGIGSALIGLLILSLLQAPKNLETVMLTIIA